MNYLRVEAKRWESEKLEGDDGVKIIKVHFMKIWKYYNETHSNCFWKGRGGKGVKERVTWGKIDQSILDNNFSIQGNT